MAHTDAPPPGPDLASGVPLSSVPDAGVLAGHVDGAPVLLARLDDGIHAIGGACTHYGGPLAEGLRVGDEIRCPWHHACFSLRTGKALKAPAFAALATWRVDVVGDQVFVREQQEATGTTPASASAPAHPRRIVIIGGGAAAFAAATRLRELGFGGTLTMLSADDDAPCDRPNLSKDYLAGTAQEDWIPLQSPEYYAERNIDLRLRCEATAIETDARQVLTRTGERFDYDALLIATGAAPVRPATPGFDRPNVFVLRSLADARAIIAAAADARTVVLIGAGFIGMEAAGALRTRGLDVHVVAREAVPMERVFGRELGNFITAMHGENGVTFHLQSTATQFEGNILVLEDGTRIATDLVIVGVGVEPRVELAASAGLRVQDGILVDATLRTSDPHIFAAGDVARHPLGADLVRIEHWVHAGRMGQAAAANMLGMQHVFDDVPFFWTHHDGLDIRYTGHAERWDDVRIDGALPARDCTARFFREGRLLAAASIGRDLENLSIEAGLRPGRR